MSKTIYQQSNTTCSLTGHITQSAVECQMSLGRPRKGNNDPTHQTKGCWVLATTVRIYNQLANELTCSNIIMPSVLYKVCIYSLFYCFKYERSSHTCLLVTMYRTVFMSLLFAVPFIVDYAAGVSKKYDYIVGNYKIDNLYSMYM